MRLLLVVSALVLALAVGSSSTASAIPLPRAHPSASADGVLSELDTSISLGAAAPGEQCFSSNDGQTSDENKLYSYTTFCEQVTADLAEPYAKEADFRQACTDKYGMAKCKQQCVQLAQLFDGAIVGKAPAGDKPYGISRGSAEYTINQRDCENCLRLHQCTPKQVIA